MSSNLVLRNYKPKDANLQANLYKEPSTNNQSQLSLEQSSLLLDYKESDNIDLHVLPRNPNWDLKRDLAPMMEVLERKTQRAIVEIVRERLTKVGNNNDNNNSGIGKVYVSSISTLDTSTSSSSSSSSSSSTNTAKELDEEYKGPLDTIAAASALRRAGHYGEEEEEEENIRNIRKSQLLKNRLGEMTLSSSSHCGEQKNEILKEKNEETRGRVLSNSDRLGEESKEVAKKRKRYDSDDE
jgi:coiled-coil domain-containing protein 12